MNPILAANRGVTPNRVVEEYTFDQILLPTAIRKFEVITECGTAINILVFVPNYLLVSN